MATITIGGLAPDIRFELLNGRTTGPADFKGQKVVLFFCPDDDVLFGIRRLHDFAALADEFEHAGTWIIGLVKDPTKVPKNFLLAPRPAVPLALDADGAVSRAFGLHPDSDVGRGHDRDSYRSTFLIDRDGTISRIWRHPNAVGHAQEVLEATRRLK